MKLLLVENEDTYIRVVRRALPEIEVVAAKTLRRAIQLLSNDTLTFDGALVDLNLTIDEDDYSGYQVLELLRDRRPGLPAAIVTGAPLRGLVANGLIERFGVVDVLLKGDPKRTSTVGELRDCWKSLVRAGVEHRRHVVAEQLEKTRFQLQSVVQQELERVEQQISVREFSRLPARARAPILARQRELQKRIARVDELSEEALRRCRQARTSDELTVAVESYKDAIEQSR